MSNTILTIPPLMAIQSQDWGFDTFDAAFGPGDTGSSQIAILGHPRRTCALVSEGRIPVRAEAAAWRAVVHALRGRLNPIAVYSLGQPVPRGTARGNWTAQAAPAGASTLIINLGAEQAAHTLLQGDWIGVNQDSVHRQLLHVQADAVANGAGVITVQFAFVLRRPVEAESVVVWDRPTCRMRATAGSSNWTDEKNTQGGFSIDLIESWDV